MSSARVKDLLVLDLLRAHPTHGYGLVQILEQGLGPAAGLRRAAVYTALARMADRGWLTSRAEPGDGGPDRAVYRVTPAGAEAHGQLVRQLVGQAAPATQPLAVLISVLDELDPEERATALARWRAQRTARLAELQPLSAHPGAWGAAVRLLVRTTQAELAAVDELAAIPATEAGEPADAPP